MILTSGEKIFVAHRRLFEKDAIRFFVGTVDFYDAGIARATGHSYVRDNISGAMLEKVEERTKLFAISSGTLLFYVLPDSLDLDSIQFVDTDGRLSMTDDHGFVMNLSDSPRGGQV